MNRYEAREYGKRWRVWDIRTQEWFGIPVKTKAICEAKCVAYEKRWGLRGDSIRSKGELEMTTQKYRVAVTKIIEVSFDMDKLDDEFWSDFNTSISDRGGVDMRYLAEHAGWNYVQGEGSFIEGIGDLKEMNITISDVDSEVDVIDLS